MRLHMPVLAAGAMFLSTAAAYADFGDQLAMLLDEDGAHNDRFGNSVAISGTTAIVGAHLDDDNGEDSGSAFLFDTTTGRQIAKLLPNDGAEDDHFGRSVAISGDTAIVGARLDDDHGDSSGSAYLFDATTGRQLVKLLPNDGAENELFGKSVAISGATAIVAVPWDDDNGDLSGSAYLFDTTTGRQIAKLLPDDGAAGDQFGWSVAISGTPGNEIAIVSAPDDDDNGIDSGSAYLFDATTGRQIAKLLPDDGAAWDAFGHSVAIGGPPGSEIAVVGASNDGDSGPTSGSAYVFDATGRQVAKLLADDGAPYDVFGSAVGIGGASGAELAIVGAFGDDDDGSVSGSAYLFDTTTGQQLFKLLPDNGTPNDRFGSSVAIAETTAIVGAYFYGHQVDLNHGAAYLFDALAAAPCPWDLTGDGVVDVHDLIELVHNFGPCDKGDCPADFNGDGIINARDLVELVHHFGPCS